MTRVLLVDDDRNVLRSLEKVLTRRGFEIRTVDDGQQALSILQNEGLRIVDVIVVDLKMPGMDGLTLLKRIRAMSPVPVVVLTGYGSIRSSVEAMKNDAFEYLLKPASPEHIVEVLARAARSVARAELSPTGHEPRMIVGSEPMRKVVASVDKIATTPFTVMIQGESGTGKELVARTLHQRSYRNGRPFVAVNCAALNPMLVESAFLGHRRGSFTGAESHRDGFFAAADGGTLFLDEIGDFPYAAQGALLRVLEERCVTPVGATAEQPVDVRVVAATNRNLEEQVERGKMRQDLYFRLNVVQIAIPPLRERIVEVPLLVEHFIESVARRLGMNPLPFDSTAVDRLMEHHWPGNVRELRNVVERSFAMCDGEQVEIEHLPSYLRNGRSAPDGGSGLEVAERRAIEAALASTQGRKADAAKLLGVNRKRLYRRMKSLGMYD